MSVEAERPIVDIAGERVALGPMRDVHVEVFTLWFNDYAMMRTLGQVL